jgi:hypothetical protein
MRFLKTQSINRRMIYDDRIAVTTLDAIVMNTPKNLLIPKGVESNRGGNSTGMIRYNTDTDQFEGYQAGAWRQFSFKESTKIRLQNLGGIDGYSYFYGPLDTAFYDPTTVTSSNPTISFGGQNILVFVENVFQIFNTNYVVTQNPTAGVLTTAQSNAGSTTLTFASTALIPKNSVVTGSAYLQAGTTCTVTSSTQVTLSLPVSGGNIVSSTPITFTAPVGYYLNFTSDPVYASMIGKQITVLLGFDK